MRDLPVLEKRFFFYVFYAAIFGAVAYFSTLLSPIIDEVTTRTGGIFSGAIIIASLILFPFWMWLILRKDFLKALALQVLLLNISGRAGDLFGIVAYTLDDGTEQKVSLTTLLILIFVFYLLVNQVRMRRPERSFKAFECLLWLFAILTTFSQFVNHSFSSAFWLSLGAVWQYVALFYIVSAVVLEQTDIRYLLKCIVSTILLSIVFRIAVRGQTFSIFDASNFERLGSVSFGSYVYYAGYVAFVIILTFYLLRTTSEIWAQAYWMIGLGILFTELLNTFTRGGILAVFFLALLPLWRRERIYFFKILTCGLLVFLILGQTLTELITSRGLSLDFSLLEQQGVATRLWLYSAYLPHFFDNFGLGYGIGHILYFSDAMYYSGRELPVHSMLMEVSQMAGGFAALVVMVMHGFVWWELWRVSRGKNPVLATTTTFFLLALLSWFFFANATGISILFYTPYEATILMYIVLFMSIILIGRGNVLEAKR